MGEDVEAARLLLPLLEQRQLRPAGPQPQLLRPLQCPLYPEEEEDAADKVGRERIPQLRQRRSNWHSLSSIPTPWLLLRTGTSS